MSVMIAVEHNGRIAVAADSRWASGWDIRHNATCKVQVISGLLVTVGPDSGWEQVLWDEIASLASREEDWPRKWPGHVLGAAQHSLTRRMTEQEGLKDRSIIVVWAGRLFQVHADGGIVESTNGLVTTGCGGDFARAAAVVLRRRLKSARAIAEQAVLVACELSAGCAPPVVCEVVRGGGRPA